MNNLLRCRRHMASITSSVEEIADKLLAADDDPT